MPVSKQVLQEIIQKLVGPICPLGDYEMDMYRSQSMEIYIDTIDLMINDVLEVIKEYNNDQEESVKKIVSQATDFIKSLEEIKLDET